MSELQNRRDLMAVVIFGSAHVVSRAVEWGLGVFFYGDFPRCCHVLQEVRRRNFDDHVRNMLRSAVLDDLQLMGKTAQDYMRAVQFQYEYARGIDKCALSHAHPHEPLHDSAVPELPSWDILWRILVRLVL